MKGRIVRQDCFDLVFQILLMKEHETLKFIDSNKAGFYLSKYV